MKTFLYFLIGMLQISILSAQQNPQRRVGVLSPVPIFPKDGQIASEQANQYVFLDPVNHDLVLYYPSDPSANGQGNRTKALIHLSNQFEPSIAVEFNRDAAGLIDYRYTIRSKPHSKDQIRFLSLTTPNAPSPAPEPPLAGTAILASTQHEWAPSDWAAPSVNTSGGFGRVIAWSAGPSGKAIGPGEAYSGFVLSGQSLEPGFVMAQLSSASQLQSLESLASQDAPTAVKDQLRRLDDTHFHLKTVLTLGPKYTAQDAKLSRAADFYMGAQMLIQAGHLKQDSSFVTEMMSVLKGYLDGAAQSPSMPIEHLPESQLRIESSPSNWLESQILEAMKISIGIKGA